MLLIKAELRWSSDYKSDREQMVSCCRLGGLRYDSPTNFGEWVVECSIDMGIGREEASDLLRRASRSLLRRHGGQFGGEAM